jgi:multidrug efflux system membrane fusion protein
MSAVPKFKNTLSRHPWIIAVAIGIAVAVWMASGAVGRDRAPTPNEAAATDRPLTEVQVRSLEAETVMRYLTLYGRTAPSRQVELKAETTGRVVSIGAERGERVEKGAVLLTFDARDRQARLTQARALVKQRELEYEGRKKLKAEGYAAETQLAEAVANLELARAELRRAELDLSYMTLRAPFDGAVLDRHVEIGDYLTPGDPVADYVDNRTLVVTADIAEKDIGLVRESQAAEAALVTGQIVRGKLRYVSPVAEPSTRTFTVELALDNADGALASGVTAELKIPVGNVLAHKVSPAVLTLDDDGTLGVKLVNDRGEVEFYAADMAVSTSDGVWLAGLPSSANVITVGQGFVRAGERVVSVPESATSETLRAGFER